MNKLDLIRLKLVKLFSAQTNSYFSSAKYSPLRQATLVAMGKSGSGESKLAITTAAVATSTTSSGSGNIHRELVSTHLKPTTTAAVETSTMSQYTNPVRH